MKKMLYVKPMIKVEEVIYLESMLASQAGGSGTGKDLSLVSDYDGQDFDDLFN